MGRQVIFFDFLVHPDVDEKRGLITGYQVIFFEKVLQGGLITGTCLSEVESPMSKQST